MLLVRMNKMSRNPIIFMFSGQGSQYYHMGQELYYQNPVFKKWMDGLDHIVLQNAGFSVINEIYNNNRRIAEKFDDILFTHPAIFMAEYSLSRVLIESGIDPDYVLGASLGEFTAAAVAGVISVEEALEFLLKQAELIKKNCDTGFMMAIIANPDLYQQSLKIYGDLELAAVNYNSHFVISGGCKNLANIENHLKTKNVLFQTLPVQYGFHSANVDPIRAEYQNFLSGFSYKKPDLPMISCVFGSRITEILPDYFWNVVREPILFPKAIMELEKQSPLNYIDLGPSGTLVNFIKNIIHQESLSQYYDFLNPFGQDIKKYERLTSIFCI